MRSDDLVGNLLRAAEFQHNRFVTRTGGPVDKGEWLMTPQTVNAYYNSTTNEITFPAAILRWPFFDKAADPAVNYGGIGSVIGHEISHGFDDSGRQFDGDGNLRDWWTEEDGAKFKQRAGELVKQYSGYSVLDGRRINGELTLGENIGDLSGMAVAFKAYKLSLGGKPAPEIDGFTGDQRFFLGWAQVWRRNYRDEELLKRLVTDPHSPSEFRANGPATQYRCVLRCLCGEARRSHVPRARRAREDLVKGKFMRKLMLSLIVVLAAANLAGCGYNKLQNEDESVKAAWSEVVNQYQRRADLIPNLVAAVKGFAAQEERVLVGVTEARAKATSIQLTPELINDPAAFAKFQAAQGELTQALEEPAGHRGALSRAQVRRELPRPAGAARRNGEPHRGGAQPLHRRGEAIQRDGARVPHESHREDVRLRGEEQFHRGERSGDLHGADGDFRYLDALAVGGARRSGARHTSAGELNGSDESRAVHAGAAARRPCAGGARAGAAAAARGARHRSHRHAHRGAAVRAR